MGERRWRWRWRSMRRLRRTRNARGCSGAGGVVHVLNGVVRGDGADIEWIAVGFPVEGILGDDDVEAQLVEGALDADFGWELDVAERLVVVVEGLGLDLAVGIVDVLAPGQHIDAADVDDAQG